MLRYKSIVLILLICVICSCKQRETHNDTALTNTESNIKSENTFILSEAFKSYWYSGTAEITSFKLEQARYGELRQGSSVLVFVTEDFLPEKQVKADHFNNANTSVLKLNMTKNFTTGIYPYSIMQSTFYPIKNKQHALKISCSIQEWCGQAYSQLNNKKLFEINSHSYFESEGDQYFKLDKAVLENEIWTQLRINPSSLPTGTLKMIPSFEYIRLKHIELKAYQALAELNENSYSINYPDLNRTLTINFNPVFPYEITGWEDTYQDGYGLNAKTLTTKATQLKTIKSAYWSKNKNADEVLRETLMLN
ncbi:septum formation inhibitor Maf [Psychroserpens sp.]|uniref:septum formation inhibitor Maf n=1 Tax=Psychroserpens sp. TaxID=2020870 RepID=UPI00385A09E0